MAGEGHSSLLLIPMGPPALLLSSQAWINAETSPADVRCQVTAVTAPNPALLHEQGEKVGTGGLGSLLLPTSFFPL